MKITVEEDRPMEFIKSTPEELASRLYSGFVDAAERVFKAKIEKGGEIDALAELQGALQAGFKARLDRIRAEIESAAQS